MMVSVLCSRPALPDAGPAGSCTGEQQEAQEFLAFVGWTRVSGGMSSAPSSACAHATYCPAGASVPAVLGLGCRGCHPKSLESE